MKRKKGNSFEQHIDKIVIGLSAVIGLWLIWVFLLSNPFSQTIGGEKVGPGRIDEKIEQRARLLQQKLDEPPVPMRYSGTEGARYREVFANSIQKVPLFQVPLPGFGSQLAEAKRMYRLPEIPDISDIAIEAIRTVVYLPEEEVDREVPYAQVPTKLGDMDLVSIQGTFDIPKLVFAFRESFAHPRMKPEWIDEKLAMPVFAAIHLERRQENPEGGWSEWTRVRPTQINSYKKMFTLPEKVSDLDISLPVKIDLFRQFEVQREILQPTPYDIAAPKEIWLAPTFHAEYRKMIEKEESDARKAEQESKRLKAEQEREARNRANNPNTGRTRPGVNQPGQADRDRQVSDRNRRQTDTRRGMPPEEMGYPGYPDPSGRILPGGRVKPAERVAADVVNDFEKKRFQVNTDWNKLKEPAVFWAHDDSISEPGVYQYRLRLGVFNPVAGKDWLAEGQKELTDQVILWSSYSPETEPIQIEPMHYFFPQKYMAEQGSLEVKVSKFHLGQWRSEVFQIQPGEMIGGKVEPKTVNPLLETTFPGLSREEMAYRDGGMMNPLQNLPREIDFSTGMVFVDLIASTQWIGNSSQNLQEVLYSSDGLSLRQIPLESRNWPSELQTKLTQIKMVETDKPMQYVARGQNARTFAPPPVPYMGRDRDRGRPGDMYGPGGVPVPR